MLEGDTTLEVEDTKDFPKEPGFLIQIKNEFLKVTEVGENFWTVERGVEQGTSQGARRPHARNGEEGGCGIVLMDWL